MEQEQNKQQADVRVRSSDWLADGFAMPKLLKPIEHYRERLEALRKRCEFARDWKLNIEKKTNRHPMTGGGRWGWYTVFPFTESEDVGFWDDNGRDDLRGVDFQKWAESANDKMRDGQ